jgi:hypothetical protein
VLTQTATARCEGTTKSGCRSPAMTGTLYCHGHHPGRVEDRVRIASAGGRGRSQSQDRTTTGHAWGGRTPAEQDRLDEEVRRAGREDGALAQLIETRSRAIEDEGAALDRMGPPPAGGG